MLRSWLLTGASLIAAAWGWNLNAYTAPITRPPTSSLLGSKRLPRISVSSSPDRDFTDTVMRRHSLLEEYRLGSHPSVSSSLRGVTTRHDHEGNDSPAKAFRVSRRWRRILTWAFAAVISATLCGLRSASASSAAANALIPDLLAPSSTAVLPLAAETIPYAAMPSYYATSKATATSAVALRNSFGELKLMLRLVYASFVGACLGKERAGSASRYPASAGVRTMALVSLGAATFTVCSTHGFATGDPSRMAANVASGVGFVGAGVITTTTAAAGNNDTLVHGLTTAAAIWLSAAVGVASGVGLYGVSATGAALTIAILRLGRKIPPTHAPPTSSRSMEMIRKTPIKTKPPRRVKSALGEKMVHQDFSTEKDALITLQRSQESPRSVDLDEGSLEVHATSVETPSRALGPPESSRQSNDVSCPANYNAGESHQRNHRTSSAVADFAANRSASRNQRWTDSWDDDVIVHRNPLFAPETLLYDLPHRLWKSAENFLP